MKTTSMRADLGDDEGIVIRHHLLSSKISGYFFPDVRIKSIQQNSLFFFFPFQYFQTK